MFALKLILRQIAISLRLGWIGKHVGMYFIRIETTLILTIWKISNNIMNTKLKLIIVFLGGVITTLVIEYLLRWQLMVILIYWFFK